MSNMQDMLDDPTFALPYWNFDIKGRECDICNNELLGARSTLDMSFISANSVFCQWRVILVSVKDYDGNCLQRWLHHTDTRLTAKARSAADV